MNWQLFSPTGYLSIVLSMVMLVLWVLHAVRRPRRWLCHYSVLVGLAALACAEINSRQHVNRIQVDHSEELAAAKAQQAAARQAAEDARGKDVAQIRFAEDGADDFLDAAGMDEADLKYIKSFDESAVPEWKKQKKERSGAQQDDSLEGMLNTNHSRAGMDVEVLESKAPREPIMMPEAVVMLANRIDSANLKLIRWLLILGVITVVLDYLRRINVYGEAYLPLPLPGMLSNSFTTVPAQWHRPAAPRRKMTEELAWMIRRGDSFLYLTDAPAAAAAVPETMYRLPRAKWPVEVLRVNEDDTLLDNAFIFEALWYGRASFVVNSAARAESVLADCVERLRGRRETRARVNQTVHVVWHMARPVPHEIKSAFERLAPATGWSLLEEGARGN